MRWVWHYLSYMTTTTAAPFEAGDQVQWHQPGQDPYRFTGTIYGPHPHWPGFWLVRWIAPGHATPYDARVHESNIRKVVELVQDQSTNNLHRRGPDVDGVPKALCHRRYRVSTYAGAESQASLREQYDSWNSCPRCEAKAARLTEAAAQDERI